MHFFKSILFIVLISQSDILLALTDLKQSQVELSHGKYQVYTSGNPSRPMVIFLHGFPEHGYSWKEVMEVVGDKYYSVSFDQRGYGNSPVTAELADYKIPVIAQDVLELAAHYNSPKFHLVAHDWGASIAYFIALMRPDLVDSLTILNGPHPFLYTQLLQNPESQQFKASQYIFDILSGKINAELAIQIAESVIFSIPNRFLQQPETQAVYRHSWNRPGAMDAQLNWYRALDFVFVPPEAKPYYMVKVPTLLLWGEKDAYLTKENLVGIEEVIADLKLVRFPDAGHFLQHEKFQNVVKELTTFLDQQAD